MIRSLSILLVFLVVACDGGGEPDVSEAGVPQIPHEGPPPSPGTVERARWDVRRIVGPDRIGDPERAERVIGELERYMAAEPGRVGRIEALRVIARIRSELNQASESAAAHRRLAELLPEEQAAEIWFETARALMGCDRFDECLEIVERLGRLDLEGPMVRDLPVLKADALVGAGRPDDAVATFRAEIERWGDTSPAWDMTILLVQLLIRMGRDEDALKTCSPLWEKRSAVFSGQMAGTLTAWVLARRGERDAARKILTRLERFADEAIKPGVRAQLAALELLGKPAPTLAGRTLRGKAVSAKDLEGKTLLVIFWDPDVVVSGLEVSCWSNAAAGRPEGRPLVIGVPLSGKLEAIRRTVADLAIAAPQRLMSADESLAWRVVTVPWTYVVGPDGTVIGYGWPLGRSSDLPASR